ARLDELKRIAPDVLFVPVKTANEAAKEAADSDAVLGFCTAEIVAAGNTLRWIQIGHAGVEKDLSPEVVKSKIVVTNTKRLYGPNVADQAMALLLTLTRGMALGFQPDKGGADAEAFRRWTWLKSEVKPQELHGKSMLIVGLGGIGTQIARRANGFGMRVMAVDPNPDIVRPDFVFSLDHQKQTLELLPKADVVVLACPLTAETRGMFGASQFAAMKPSAYFINIARGGLVKTPDMIAALKNKTIAGVGLDVTDPEPLPNDSPLWRFPNGAVSPHLGGQPVVARH